jgi:hypothetical protein
MRAAPLALRIVDRAAAKYAGFLRQQRMLVYMPDHSIINHNAWRRERA